MFKLLEETRWQLQLLHVLLLKEIPKYFYGLLSSPIYFVDFLELSRTTDNFPELRRALKAKVWWKNFNIPTDDHHARCDEDLGVLGFLIINMDIVGDWPMVDESSAFLDYGLKFFRGVLGLHLVRGGLHKGSLQTCLVDAHKPLDDPGLRRSTCGPEVPTTTRL